MRRRFQSFFDEIYPDGLSKKRFVLGFSGGSDSVALAHLMKEHYPNIPIHLVYVHHSIRPQDEIDGDIELLHDTAKILGYEAHVIVENIPQKAKSAKQSIETMGRLVRYQVLHTIAAQTQSDAILVGHHLNDSVESFFYQLIKGTKSAGLGIHSVRQLSGTIKVLRPLHAVTKDEILAVCEHENWRFTVDSSNEHEAYSRNRIRQDILPTCESLNPKAVHAIGDYIQYQRDQHAYLMDECLKRASCIQFDCVGTIDRQVSILKSAMMDWHPFLKSLFLHKLLSFLQLTATPNSSGFHTYLNGDYSIMATHDEPPKRIETHHIQTILYKWESASCELHIPGKWNVVISTQMIRFIFNKKYTRLKGNKT